VNSDLKKEFRNEFIGCENEKLGDYSAKIDLKSCLREGS